MQQRGVLRHHRNVAAQAVLADSGDVLPVDADFAAVQVVEAQEGVDQGRFARAAASDQADFFAGTDVEREIVQDVRLFHVVLVVAEANAVEGDFAARDFQFFAIRAVLYGDGAGHHRHAVGNGADVFREAADFPHHPGGHAV